MRTLTEVVASLRVGTRESLEAASKSKAIIANPSPPVGYVRPPVSILQWDEPARVLLIDALGAVGKSAAAAFVAQNRRWILVDAAELQVGHYGLTGLLHDSFGGSEFFSDLENGAVGIVVDALDEAHLKSGTTNFFAFLEDLRNLSRSVNVSGINMILLTRPDTAEDIKLKFDDMRESLATARLGFFTDESARVYISSYLESRASVSGRQFYEVEKKNPGGFQKLRETRLHSVASIFLGTQVSDLAAEWRRLESFLGYAPVLGVIAETLAVTNPFRVAHDAAEVSETSGTILSMLVRALLEREQEKFVANAGEKLTSITPADVNLETDWLYRPDEQVQRLASHVFSVPFDRQNSLVPEHIRPTYETHAEQWLKDHPFLSGPSEMVNAVFRDYVLASVSANPMPDQARPSRLPVGPFYSKFVHELAPAADEGIAVVSESQVQNLVRSTAQAVHLQPISWLYSQTGGSATLELWDNYSESFLCFSVENLTGVLEFERELEDGVLVTDEAVRVVGESGRFDIGPSFFLHAGHLELACRELSVGRRWVHVAADEVNAAAVSQVSLLPSGRFTVRGADEWPIFHQYLPRDSSDQYVALSDFVDLRAILRAFRRQSAGRFSIYADKLDQGIVKKSTTRQDIRARLLEISVLAKVGDHYELDTDALGGYGVSLKSLIAGEPDDATLNFLLELRGSLEE